MGSGNIKGTREAVLLPSLSTLVCGAKGYGRVGMVDALERDIHGDAEYDKLNAKWSACSAWRGHVNERGSLSAFASEAGKPEDIGMGVCGRRGGVEGDIYPRLWMIRNRTGEDVVLDGAQGANFHPLNRFGGILGGIPTC